MSFDLLLFSTNPALIGPAVAHGVSGVIVDWEHLGKEQRQANADTEINRDTVEDLERVRKATPALVLCRINGPGPHTASEVEAAIAGGADEILVPMVRRAAEVEDVLRRVDGRCAVGLFVETLDAVEAIRELASLPIGRAYVGLNDLAIERKSGNIFAALVDGTVDRIREAFTRPFGFGGLTDPVLGEPIPCRLLIGEMVRLRCDFSVLRRSYRRDVATSSPAVLLSRLRVALEHAALRPERDVARDRVELARAVAAWGRTGDGRNESTP